MKNFKEIKKEILKRAKSAEACSDEYKRAYKSEDFKGLLKVVTDNFQFCYNNKVVDIKLLEEIGNEICNENDLYFNSDCNKGYLLVDNSNVEASGKATVITYGNANVIAYNNANVTAYNSATVEAYDNSTVRASDNAYTISYNKIEHKISGCAIVNYYHENRVVLGEGFKTVERK